MRGKHSKRLLLVLVLIVVAVLLIRTPLSFRQNSEKTNSLNELNTSDAQSRAFEVLSEMLTHFSSRQEKKWLPYNVSGYEEGFEGIVSNGTSSFEVAVFVYGNLSECRKLFKRIENNLNASLAVVNSSEGESCIWRLFSGNKSYYIECSGFWNKSVLLVVRGSNEKAVERLTWWFPTQSCLRPGTRLVVQT